METGKINDDTLGKYLQSTFINVKRCLNYISASGGLSEEAREAGPPL
jgi:hypothetical protein